MRAILLIALMAFIGYVAPTADNYFVSAATAGWDLMTDDCREKLFPMTIGGAKDEFVTCVIDDKINNQIVVTGNSTSENFVPAANDHAFAFAVDYEGNWKWGKFFYNVSFAMSTISGCHLNTDNKLVVLGTGDSVPVIMELELVTAQVTKFISLDKIGASSSNQPWYKTYNAIFHDVSKIPGQRSYYYVAFVMNDKTQILKIDDEPDNRFTPARHEVAWNVEYEYTYNGDTEEWKNKKTPRFLHQDVRDPSRMYLLGRYYGKGSVIKFAKRTFVVDYRIGFHCYDATEQPAQDAGTTCNIASPGPDIG